MKDQKRHPERVEADPGHADSHEVFDNPERFIEKFDGAERDEWQKPDAVIQSFRLPDDAVVVEIGAGTGYFAVRLAPQLKNGKLICYDTSSQMTSYLKNRAEQLDLTNIEARTTGPDGSLKLEEKAELIFSVDIYHHLKDRAVYFSKMLGHLKPDGALVVIDRTEEKIEGHPTSHRVPKEKLIEEMKKAGFEVANDFDFLLPVQYYLSFKRAL